ncbi:hypothetical protein SAY86_004260 [Trapa natans]|uniref:Uncharacterized protein n=1 Tax=Trapa natans TaxID=22666 RepID=A0AAN7N6A1_TRANT|nr:hypothetical protein SAY86_004260 [Trapa natans]
MAKISRDRSPALARTADGGAVEELRGDDADSKLEGISSGLGGLGFEGIVGRELVEEPPLAGTEPPEEGNRGAVSGEIPGREGSRGSAIVRDAKETTPSAVKRVMTQKAAISSAKC